MIDTVHDSAGSLFEKNLGGGSRPAGVTKLYRAQLGGRSRLIAFRRAGTLYYAGVDHLGGTVRVADSAFAASSQMRYSSYGQHRDTAGLVQTDQLFTGQTWDALTGLYFYGSRYYDAEIGRFAQPDTVVPDWSDPQAINRYSYVRSNPLKFTDPTGHVPVLLLPIAVDALVGAGVSMAAYALTHGGDDFSWGGLAGAGAAGAVGGAVSVVAGPVAGTVARFAGLAAADAVVLVGTGAINATAGVAGYAAGGAVQDAVNAAFVDDDMFQPSAEGVAASAIVGGAAGVGTALAFPTQGMRTLAQAEYFTPRTLRGLAEGLLHPSEAPNAANLVWRGGTVSAAVGILAPPYAENALARAHGDAYALDAPGMPTGSRADEPW